MATRHFHNIWLYTKQDGSQIIEAKQYDYNPLWTETDTQKIIWQGLAESPEDAIHKAKSLRGSWSRIVRKLAA